MTRPRAVVAPRRLVTQAAAAAVVGCERLESRCLFDALFPTAAEQFHVELINRARANPGAEAARLGIALNEGVPAEDTISNTPKQPLAVSPFLTDAARDHSQWMIDTDTFSHTGAGGTNPGQRMANAGYAPANTFGWGENIAILGESPGVPNINQASQELYENLFVDAGYPGRGHRVNILTEEFKEVGAGLAAGPFVFRAGEPALNAVVVTEDFAYRPGANSFLTGVAYTDAVTDDNFYTPGEGLGGVTVSARRTTDGAVFTATTWAAGGYSLQLAPGTYHVTASGAGLNGTVDRGNVTIGTQNVKVDFTPGADVPPAVTQVFVRGTTWNQTYLSSLQSSGQGSNQYGYSVPAGALQLDELPWGNLNQVAFRFSENVTIQTSHLTVTTTRSTPLSVAGVVNYNGSANIALFTLSRPLGNETVTFTLRGSAGGVADTDGTATPLDGEWANGADAYPSGNGSPGGDFVFSVRALPGDANASGTVDVGDLGVLATNFNQAGRNHRQGDFNGDATVDVADLGVLATNFGRTTAAVTSDAAVLSTSSGRQRPRSRPVDVVG